MDVTFTSVRGRLLFPTVWCPPDGGDWRSRVRTMHLGASRRKVWHKACLPSSCGRPLLPRTPLALGGRVVGPWGRQQRSVSSCVSHTSVGPVQGRFVPRYSDLGFRVSITNERELILGSTPFAGWLEFPSTRVPCCSLWSGLGASARYGRLGLCARPRGLPRAAEKLLSSLQ